MSKRELKPDKAFQKVLGERIRKLRNDVGWTQVDLAIFSKISEYQVSVIENGHEAPNLQTLVAIGLALGKKPSEFLDFPYPFKINTSFPKGQHKVGSTVIIRDLIAGGFFNKGKIVSEVVVAVKKRTNGIVRSSEISGILLRLVKEESLKVVKKNSRNFYKN